MLVARDLRIELSGGDPIIDQVTLSVCAGEVLGLVGESGSGKTTAALALLASVRTGARIARGEIEFDGRTTNLANPRAAAQLRGRLASYVPQDPAKSLNPSLRVFDSVRDILRAHTSEKVLSGSVTSALESVGLPTDDEFAHRYPYQLSGGQQQRVTIAMAIATRTPLLVLDEPTTGLDVVTQARVLAEIERLKQEFDLAMVYVSHDLAVIGQVADRIAVMYAGRIVEEGPTDELFFAPTHPYTRGLIASVPDMRRPQLLRSMPGVAVGVGERPQGCAFSPRCGQRVGRCEVDEPPLVEIIPRRSARCFEWQRTPPLSADQPHATRSISSSSVLVAVEGLKAVHGRGRDAIVAADDVSFSIRRGESVALIGESGSGKSTIARCIAGLHQPAAGRVLLDGHELEGTAKRRSKEDRRLIQLVFQNPYDSLNPRHRIADAIARPARVLRDLSPEEAREEVDGLLERVRLPARLAARFPGELSGGECQRVAIARALAANPWLLICDEITSALDVSVQAAVLDVIIELRDHFDLALLFITHDLGVVANVADRMLVLERGIVREEGRTLDVIRDPHDAYTQRLIDAAPALPSVGQSTGVLE